jgi:hypothetical protein
MWWIAGVVFVAAVYFFGWGLCRAAIHCMKDRCIEHTRLEVDSLAVYYIIDRSSTDQETIPASLTEEAMKCRTAPVSSLV